MIGLNAYRMDTAVAQLFANQDFRNAVFSGTQNDSFEGQSFTASWSIGAPPSFDLRSPATDEWNNSLKADGTQTMPTPNCFIININALNVNLVLAGVPKQSTIQLSAVCSASTSGNAVALHADAVIIDLSNSKPIDKYMIKHILIPKVLDFANTTLKGMHIPIPSFMGVTLTPPSISILNKSLITGFNLAGRPQPDLTGVPLPGTSFFALASPALVQQVVNYVVTNNLRGKQFSTSGSEGAAGFSADYNASGTVNSITANISSSNLTTLNATINASLTATGGISTPIGYVIQAGQVVYQGIQTAAGTVAHYANPSNW